MNKMIVLAALVLASGQSMAQSIINIRQHPIGLFVETLAADVDVRVSDTLTLGLAGKYTNGEGGGYWVDRTYWSLGVRGNYFYQGVERGGWFTGASLNYGEQEYQLYTAMDGKVSYQQDPIVFAEMLHGYQFVFQDFFNINLALGYIGMYGATDDRYTQWSKQKVGISPSGEFTLGWRF